MTLRERCVEAGAAALDDTGPHAELEHYSEAVLDAILAVLREHADEWLDVDLGLLLAVLEGSDE